ncbi:type VI secretion system ATPase TssH [Arsenophonus apicola]|uniref:type VI secretion system ATPase TssH n=1 Tax=Arsenophonus apicola TaxID=2879119 RepID=UPI00387A36B8
MSSNLKQIINNLSLPARECLDSAASLAVSHTHHEIESEHLLLMLLEKQTQLVEQLCYHANGDALKLLEACQSSLAQLRSGCHRAPVFSVMLTDWLESAWMYATIRWQVDKLSPLLLLASLLAERELHQGLPLYLQQALQINGELLDKAVEMMMQQSVTSSRSQGQASALMKYAHHLTQAARDNKLDPVLGREKEIRQLIDILLRRRQNNPLLTGEAGVGKTALVEGLAQRIVAGNIPAALANVELFTLDFGLLQAGASIKGEFESRLQQLLEEVKNYPLPIILFIDEAHTLIGAGGQAGQNDAANLLKPALARGELRTIAATTQAEYKKYFEKDAALARRFQLIKVDEPTQEVAIAMLRAMVPMMEQHHGVRILDSAVTEAVQLAARYITGRQLPDKSVTLLDSACARVAISQCGEPGPIEDLRAMLAQRNIERQSLLREGSPEHENISRHIEQLQNSLNALLPEYYQQQQLVQAIKAAGENEKEIAPLRRELHVRHQQHAYVFDCVDAACVADIVSGWTGIPLGRMVENERDVLLNLEQRLASRIMGQDHALAQIARQIRIAKAQLADPRKPCGVFMLVGPSGVGKTETAIALAHEMYGGERSMITVNMSEYQEAHSVAGLKWAPPGYVGYGQGGVFTESVRRRPYSVILLDEVEKAHPDVMELFFQVFDKGIMEDAEGQRIDFCNSLIILTSNVGSELIMRAMRQGVKEGDTVRSAQLDDIQQFLHPELKRFFPAAFLGRLQVIPYLPVEGEILQKIIQYKLAKIVTRFEKATQVLLSYSDSLVEYLADQCLIAESGAREIDNLLLQLVLPLLSDSLLSGDMLNKSQIYLDVHNNRVCFKAISSDK